MPGASPSLDFFAVQQVTVVWDRQRELARTREDDTAQFCQHLGTRRDRFHFEIERGPRAVIRQCMDELKADFVVHWYTRPRRRRARWLASIAPDFLARGRVKALVAKAW